MDKQEKLPLWTKNFVILLLVNFFMFVSFQLYPPALPPYLKSLGVHESLLGWYTALTTIAAFLIRPAVGVMLDYYGRKYLFLGGLTAVFTAVALMFFFPYAIPLLFLRFFQGFGWGTITTSAATISTDNIPKTRMGEGIGYYGLSISLALAVGPAVALSVSIEKLLEVSIYLMGLSIALACFLKYRIISKTERSEFKFSIEKTALIPASIICIINICYGSVVTFLVIYAQTMGISNISSYYVIYAAVLMVTRPVIGKLVDKNLHLHVMVIGLFCLTASLLCIAFASGIMMFNIAAVFYGIGHGSVQTTSQTLSVIHAEKNRIGIANATFSMGFDIGISLGSVCSGLIVAWLGYSSMFLVLIAAPLCAGMVFFTAYGRGAFMPRQ